MPEGQPISTPTRVISAYYRMLKWATPFAIVVAAAQGFMQRTPQASFEAAGPLWQTIIIHLMGFGAALWTIRILNRWTTQAGGAPATPVTSSRPYAIAATIIAYGIVDAAQLALRASIDPTAPTWAAPGAEIPLTLKLLITTSLYEEATFAAIPAVTAGLIIAVCARRRPISRTAQCATLAGCVAAGAALRGMLHLYQSPVSAAIALGWGAASVLIYWRWKSITGLVLVHSWYNSVALLADEGHDWLPWYAIGSWILLITAAAAAIALENRRHTPPVAAGGG